MTTTIWHEDPISIPPEDPQAAGWSVWVWLWLPWENRAVKARRNLYTRLWWALPAEADDVLIMTDRYFWTEIGEREPDPLQGNNVDDPLAD